MAGKLQEIKGRVEVAVGKATKNSKLQQTGKIDQAAGKLKQAVTKSKKAAIKDINEAAKVVKRVK
jgi:uncharacterized protein YjbJ (UPF0337 family)